MIYRATLIGGPCHGEVVDVLGTCWIKSFCEHEFADPDDWVTAVYEWGMDGEEWIGLFKGFFREGNLVEV